MADDKLAALITMTRALGQPYHNYVIIGEGNTSCRIDNESFWVKASGQQMHNIDEDGFVAVHFKPILEMIDDPPSDPAVQDEIMKQAIVDPSAPNRPSIEYSFHAMLLAECEAEYIGHTHPVAVNQIMCSNRGREFAVNRRFPDEVTLCGPESVFVPYADPGLPLAVAIRKGVHDYIQAHNETPKVILLANHGLIVLGQTPNEILNVTAMCVKAAEIFAGACAVGEPISMTREDVMHIHRRPDEIYRRDRFVGADGSVE